MPEAEVLCYDTEGTLNFCAPEEIFGVNDGYDVFKADIWGLGCVLYDLFFDKLAFDIPGPDRFNTEMELNMKIQKTEPDFTGGPSGSILWQQAVDLMKKLLQKDPHSRPTLPEIKIHPFVKKTDQPNLQN